MITTVKFIFIFVSLLQQLIAQQASSSWKPSWVPKPKKIQPRVYTPDTLAYRAKIRQNRTEMIQKHNSNPDRSYDMGINIFTQLTDQQFAANYLGLIPSTQQSFNLAKGIAKIKRPDPKYDNISSLWALQDKVNVNLRDYFKAKNYSDQKITALLKQYDNLDDIGIIQNVVQTQNLSFSRLLEEKYNYNQFSRLLQQKKKNYNNIDWSCLTGASINQGGCGACYALAAVSSFAAMLAIYHFGFYLELSAQQIIDCAKDSLSFGCNGGLLESPYVYMTYGGIPTNLKYPYEFSESNSTDPEVKKNTECRNKQFTYSKRYKLQSFEMLGTTDTCELMIQQLQKQPVTIGIPSQFLKFYQTGLFNDTTPVGTKISIDHAVLVVGYIEQYGFKFKNSWGSAWGIKGYGWIKIRSFYPIPIPGEGYENYERGTPTRKCAPPVIPNFSSSVTKKSG